MALQGTLNTSADVSPQGRHNAKASQQRKDPRHATHQEKNDTQVLALIASFPHICDLATSGFL